PAAAAGRGAGTADCRATAVEELAHHHAATRAARTLRVPREGGRAGDAPVVWAREPRRGRTHLDLGLSAPRARWRGDRRRAEGVDRDRLRARIGPPTSLTVTRKASSSARASALRGRWRGWITSRLRLSGRASRISRTMSWRSRISRATAR